MFYKLLIAAVLATSVVAAPADIEGRAPTASPTISLCPDNDPNLSCVTLPVVSDNCVNLTGGLTFLNKEVTWANVPGGFICTLFENFGCTTAHPQNSQDEIGLVGPGLFSMYTAPGIAGPIDFNDKTSSFTCSPL